MELSPAEQQIVKRIRRARPFVMLRQRRHELFSEDFQAELAEVYTDSAKERRRWRRRSWRWR